MIRTVTLDVVPGLVRLRAGNLTNIAGYQDFYPSIPPLM